MAHAFNTDILLTADDREEAQRDFGSIAFALDNPSLRELFKPFDERANVSKTRSRRWGVFAVLLATFALMLAAAEVLYHDLPKDQIRLIAAVGGIAGIVSVVIGVFGVMFKKRKDRWLADRLATERLRQFHFQSLVMNAGDVVRGAHDPATAEKYLSDRQKRLDVFAEEYLGNLDDHLHHLVHEEELGTGFIYPPRHDPIDPKDPAWQQLLDAYVTLRFDRQLAYCEYVLREKKGFWKQAPVRQARILGAIAMSCVLGILILHGLVFFGAVANIPWMKGPLVHVIAIWMAIAALSARTFEEGFQPEREIERMRQYRLSIKRIRARFDEATDPQEKLAAMRDMEKLTYEEMILFLQKNYEAQFVM